MRKNTLKMYMHENIYPYPLMQIHEIQYIIKFSIHGINVPTKKILANYFRSLEDIPFDKNIQMLYKV